jgi:predicted N-acetyltransferase YhbS
MPTATALRLMQERNQWTCEVEGCDNPAEEAHHVFYGQQKRAPKKLRDALNDDRNLQLVCRLDHHITGKAKTWENKVNFWQVQCERYGHDEMVAWHNALPLKAKEHYYK